MTGKKKKLCLWFAVIAIIIGTLTTISWGAGHEVYDVVVKRLGQTTQVVIQGNGPFNYKDFMLENPPRIVIDCMGSEHNLPGPRTYLLERGGIIAIRSSYTQEPTPKVRIIIDLERNMPYVVFKEGKNLIVALDAVTAAPFAQWQASKFYDYQRPPRTEAFFYTRGGDVVTEPLETTPAETPTSDEVEFTQYDDSGEQTLIDVEYENGDLVKIIRQFANWTDQNIVISPDVSGRVSVSLRQVPVRTALDIILKINGYAIVEEPGDIWRVTSIDEIRAMQLQDQARADSLEQVVPLKTEVIGIEYAQASEIMNSVAPGNRGNIMVNERKNSLIVTDTPSNIQRIRSMVRQLDTPTRQVNIEAQVIEIGNDISRDLGIQWSSSLADTAGSLLLVDFSEKLTEELSSVLSSDGSTTTEVTLNALLSALETENKAHIISRPNITVVNHQTANINSGVNVPFLTRDESGNTVTEFVQTGVILDVTPHVNPNDKITLEVRAEVSNVQAAGTGISAAYAVNSKNATTRVMVENGATAAIGGLMSNEESVVESRIPFLSKLPIVGRLLFTSERKQKIDRELLVLITPRIIKDPPENMY